MPVFTPPDRGTKYCDGPVRLSVCLSASISPKVHAKSSASVLYLLPMAEARSSSTGVAISNVLPVLWMTSYLRIMCRRI